MFKIDFAHEVWQTHETALIVFDMWDNHWCPSAAKRVEELAPFMNQVIKAARNKGILIIHAPSSVTDFYKGHPAKE